MRRIVMFLLGMLLISSQLLAQNRTITGKVTDDKGVAVPNASVTIKGTQFGTNTDADGNYKLSVPANARVLVFSSVNFQPMEMGIGSRNNISVNLKTSETALQEVVVVGYGKTTKEAFTGSAKVVSGEELANKNVSNVSQALAGEVAGVTVINPSGQPGTSATIRIRGFGSVNGNRSPLYVVDGIPFSGAISSINPEDIATMTVLKDAAATAIYGSRGANGVIVITTRNGRSRKSFVEVSGKYGTNMSLLPRYNVIKSPEQFIALGWEALYNQAVAKGVADPVADANAKLFSTSGISPNNNIWNVTSGADLIDPVTKTVKPGVTRKYNPENWEDYALQPSNRSEANVKMGGGDAKTNYYTSFGYLKDKGYTIGSDFQRASARMNLNHEVKTWLTTSFNMNYANTQQNVNGQAANSNSVFWFVDNMPPIYPLFLRDSAGNKVADPIFGGYQFDYGSNGRKFGSLTNAIADATYNTLRNSRNDLTGNTAITLKFTKDLSLENRLGVQYYNNDYVSLTNKFYGSSATQNGSIFQQKNELLNLDLWNLLRYTHRFGNHNIDAFVAHEAQKYKNSYETASGYNLVETNSLELNNAVVFNPSSSYANTLRLESFFGNVSYDYNGTYFLSATGRRDGSSRFINGNQWGTFGSVGLGWIVTRTELLKSVKVLDYLKLKASYGTNGDQEGLGYYPGYDRFDINNLNNNPSFAFNTKGNPDLTWEKYKQFDAGAEFRLGRFLSGSVDYYIKNTDNLLFNRRTATSLGYAIIQVNDGELRNNGIEFDLTGHLLKNDKYFLDLGVNGEHFNNDITRMPIDPATGKQKALDVQGLYAWSVGHSIFDFYTRNFAGVDPTDGTSTWTVYYEDKNSNGKYDVGEQVTSLSQYLVDNPDKQNVLKTGTTKNYAEATQYYIGKSSIPKLRGAVNLKGGWHGIDLSVQMLYSFGGYAYDGAYAALMANGLIGGNNWSTDILNRWQKPGDITNVPRLSNNLDLNVVSGSSRFVTKANYLSLNNVRLGYTLPSSIMRKTFMEEASVWVSGDNLWLHSARSGFNPSTDESGGSDTYRYSPLSTFTVGLRVKF